MDNQEQVIASRRVKQVMVSTLDFMGLFTKGLTFKRHTKLIEGLPEDAMLIGMAYDVRRDGIIMVIESESYEEVKLTDFPPIQMVSIQMGVAGSTKKKPAKRKK